MSEKKSGTLIEMFEGEFFLSNFSDDEIKEYKKMCEMAVQRADHELERRKRARDKALAECRDEYNEYIIAKRLTEVR